MSLHAEKQQGKFRGLGPLCIHKVKGCSVRGQNYLAIHRLSREKIKVVTGKLKSECPTVLMTVNNFSPIYVTMDFDDEEEAGDAS